MEKTSGGLGPRNILILTMLYLAVTLPFLGRSPLFDPDEGYYPQSAREMIERGDWLDPVFNGAPRWGKPVGFYFADVLSMNVLGTSEFTARLPSLAAGLGFTLVTASIGACLFGGTVGLTSGILCATAIQPSVYSRSAVPDMFLSVFVALSLLAFLKASWNKNKPEGAWLWVMYASAAAAFLSKGPLGAILPTIAIGSYLLLSGQWRNLIAIKPVRGVLLFIVIAAPWYWYMYSVHGQDFLVEHFIGRNFQRYFTNRWEHEGPLYYYIPVLIAGVFPWTAAFVAGVYSSLRGVFRHEKLRGQYLFLLCWLLGMLLFFSFSRSKLPNYVLPLYPAAVMLSAGFIHSLEGRARGIRLLALVTSVLAAVIVAVGAALLGRKLGESSGVILLWLSPVIVIVLAAVFAFRGGNGLRNWVWANALAMALFFAVLTGVAIPKVERLQAVKQLAEDSRGQLAEGEPVAVMWTWKPSLLFYTGATACRFDPNRDEWPPEVSRPVNWIFTRADRVGDVEKLSGRKAELVYRRDRYALFRLGGK